MRLSVGRGRSCVYRLRPTAYRCKVTYLCLLMGASLLPIDVTTTATASAASDFMSVSAALRAVSAEVDLLQDSLAPMIGERAAALVGSPISAELLMALRELQRSCSDLAGNLLHAHHALTDTGERLLCVVNQSSAVVPLA